MLHTGLRAEFGREFSNWDLVVMLLQEREMEEEGRLQEERMSYWLMEDWRVFQQEKGRRNRCGGDNEWLEGCNDSAWRRPRRFLNGGWWC